MRKLISAVSIAVLALGAAACGGIDTEDVEEDFQSTFLEDTLSISSDDIESVSCDDDIEAEEGTNFDCDLELSDGTQVTCEGEVTSVEDDQAEYEWRAEDCEEN